MMVIWLYLISAVLASESKDIIKNSKRVQFVPLVTEHYPVEIPQDSSVPNYIPPEMVLLQEPHQPFKKPLHPVVRQVKALYKSKIIDHSTKTHIRDILNKGSTQQRHVLTKLIAQTYVSFIPWKYKKDEFTAFNQLWLFIESKRTQYHFSSYKIQQEIAHVAFEEGSQDTPDSLVRQFNQFRRTVKDHGAQSPADYLIELKKQACKLKKTVQRNADKLEEFIAVQLTCGKSSGSSLRTVADQGGRFSSPLDVLRQIVAGNIIKFNRLS
jgi:hypothetical protein